MQLEETEENDDTRKVWGKGPRGGKGFVDEGGTWLDPTAIARYQPADGLPAEEP